MVVIVFASCPAGMRGLVCRTFVGDLRIQLVLVGRVFVGHRASLRSTAPSRGWTRCQCGIFCLLHRAMDELAEVSWRRRLAKLEFAAVRSLSGHHTG